MINVVRMGEVLRQVVTGCIEGREIMWVVGVRRGWRWKVIVIGVSGLNKLALFGILYVEGHGIGVGQAKLLLSIF